MGNPLHTRICLAQAQLTLTSGLVALASPPAAQQPAANQDFATALDAAISASTTDWVNTILRSREASQQVGCRYHQGSTPTAAAIVNYVRMAAANK
jgi:hypothetical protein